MCDKRRLQTSRPQTCRLADLRTCRHVRNSRGRGELLPPQGFCPEGEIRGDTLVTRAYNKKSTYSWNLQSVCQRKSRFAWTGATRNRNIMMTWWRQKIPKGPLRQTLWHLLCSHTSILFCVTCYQWHSGEQLFQWKLWTKRHSLSADEVIRCVQPWIYKHLESFRSFRHSLSLFDPKQARRVHNG